MLTLEGVGVRADLLGMACKVYGADTAPCVRLRSRCAHGVPPLLTRASRCLGVAPCLCRWVEKAEVFLMPLLDFPHIGIQAAALGCIAEVSCVRFAPALQRGLGATPLLTTPVHR